MRNWAFLSAAVAMGVVIGCGGSNSGTTTTTTTDGGSTDASTATTVNLGVKPGQIEFTLLTGQGRNGSRADGDMGASVTIPQFVDNRGQALDPISDSPPQVQLNSYQNQIYRINVPILNITDTGTGRPLSSREFDSMPLNLAQLRPQIDGSTYTIDTISGLADSFMTRLRVFPGRYTSIPVFLNDAQFSITFPEGSAGPVATFNKSQFEIDNSLDTFPTLPSFISDYLAFDISGIPDADKPALSTGAPASRLYLSGDNFALSEGGSRGFFESLTRTPGQTVEGRFAPPGQGVPGLPPGVGAATTPGTYSLIQPNPSDPDPFSASRITALQGIWRDYTKMILNMKNELAVSFPSSEDGDTQDVLIFSQTNTGGVLSIKNAYYGIVDLGRMTVRAYPLKNLPSASLANEITGTITQLLDTNGSLTNSPSLTRSGTISFATAPAGISGSIKFYVYRH